MHNMEIYWIHLALDRDQQWALADMVMGFLVP
jgi:hypothetical protein